MTGKERIMAKWNVDLVYGIPFTVNGIEADSRNEAIEKAKKAVEDNTEIMTGHMVDAGCLEYDQCSYSEQTLSLQERR